MAAIQTPPSQHPSRDDARREEMRREEQEKRALEAELMEFDAHSFYERLLQWADRPIPKPYKRSLHTSLFHVKEVMWQPLPLKRSELRDLQILSATTAKLLSLLRSVDQKGLECPYIHQLNRHVLEKAIQKCMRLKEAASKYMQSKGLLAKLSLLFNRTHIYTVQKDSEYFKRRLESIAMMCRHQEFAQDLMRIRREVTYRTGNVLREEDASSPQPASIRRKPSSGVKEPFGPQRRGNSSMSSPSLAPRQQVPQRERVEPKETAQFSEEMK